MISKAERLRQKSAPSLLTCLMLLVSLSACQTKSVQVATLVNGSQLEFTPEYTRQQTKQPTDGAVARTGWQPWDLALGPDGDVWVADTLHHRLLKISQTGIISLAAGDDQASRRDGTPDQARFREPHALTWLGKDLLIADTGNRLIRRLKNNQVMTESVSQELERPVALASDSQGRYYIGDAGTGKILRVYPSGVAETVIQLEAYRLLNDLLIDDKDQLYYSDSDGLWRLNGSQRTRLLAPGKDFNRIGGLGFANGNIYFTDVYQHRLMQLAGTQAKAISLDLPKDDPELRYPASIISQGKSLLLAELGGDRIRRLDLTADLSNSAKVSATIFARSGTQGFGVRRDGLDLSNPHDLLYDHLRKEIIVCDYYSNRLLRINERGQATPWLDKGELRLPTGLAQDAKGRIYVSDTHRILVIEPDGQHRVLAGDTSGYRDGPASQARFWLPWGMAVGSDGSLYIADHGNHAIRKISPDGSLVSTVAGRGGMPGFANGDGSQAQFHYPSDVIVLPNHQLLVADSWNHQLRLIDSKGYVTTYAGGNGPGLRDSHRYKAQFYLPSSLARSPSGEIFIADSWNHRIRYLTPEGSVQTLAGRGRWLNWDGGDDDGDGLFASFNQPKALVLDPNGRLLVADTGNNRLRTVMIR